MVRIVILGSNFAGLDAALTLRKLDTNLEILVIDKSNAEYYPSIHKIISGSRYDSDLQISLEDIYLSHKIDFKKELIISIDAKKNIVVTKNGKYTYDYLINALGAVSNFYGIKGVEEFAIPFKSSKNSNTIKEKIINLESKDNYSIVVAGSGLTGVELLFEIKAYLKSISKNADLHVLEATPSIAPWANPATQKFLKKLMAKDNITIHEGFAIDKVDKTSIHNKLGEKLDYDLLIWCAGLGVNPVISSNKELAKDGKGMLVDLELRSTSHKNVFGCGDSISIAEKPCPKTAHFALVQGPLVAYNIFATINNKPLKKLAFDVMGSLVSLGLHGSILVYKNFLLKHPRWLLDLMKKSIELYWIRSRSK